MFQRLTNPEQLEAERQRIAKLFGTHAEWFCTLSDGNTHALRNRELDIQLNRGRLVLSCWTERGTQSWRIKASNWTGEKLQLHQWRRTGSNIPVIELVPRAAATAIAATIRAARLDRCVQLAELACTLQPGVRPERVSLSPGIRRGQPGRYARIILRLRQHRIAVTGLVASKITSETDPFLSAALLWFTRISERAAPPLIEQLWLLAEKEMAKPLAYRVALLRKGLREAIKIYEIDETWSQLTEMTAPRLSDLWTKRLKQFPPVPEPLNCTLINAIKAKAPDAIDVVDARQGQTVRYFGLPFARVRQVMDTTHLWFGLQGSSRVLLDDKTKDQWDTLVNDLRQHRSAAAPDHRHALYRTAGEAWLESLLRRDISKLDPGLIVAPLHAQFRTSRGGRKGVRPIDLLALRLDGRLVVIELKVFEDREHVLQGADYWQRVEAHRRRGHISQAKLFGDRQIRDESPLVYLVAPTLRVHPAFQILARSITPEIEIYRFDINEDWRSGVRVMRRMRVN